MHGAWRLMVCALCVCEADENIIEQMKEVIQIYNSIGVGKFEKEDFKGLFFDTENFIFEKIMKDKKPEFYGMAIDKRKFFNDFLVKPKGYYDLIAQLERFIKRTNYTIKQYWPYENIKSYLNFFSVLSDGEFEIKQEVLDKQKSKNEVYIKTEKAKRAYKFALALTEILKDSELRAEFRIDGRQSFEQFVSSVIQLESAGATIKINSIKNMDF